MQQFRRTEPFFYVYANDVTFSNLTLRPNKLSSEDMDGGDVSITETSELFTNGYCIKFNLTMFRGEEGQRDAEMITGGRVEYCLMENCTVFLQVQGAEVEIEGCIMRNASGVGIHVRNFKENSSTPLTHNDLTITNCVMSNMVGTAINFDYGNTDYTEDINNRSTFTQNGFFDIYNWQPIDSLQLIPSGTLDGIGVTGGLQQMLFTIIQNAFDREPLLDDYKIRYGNFDHMHLGFISMGIGGPSYINYGYLPDGRRVLEDGTIEGTDEKADPDQVSWNCNMEDKRFSHFSSNDISSLESLLSGLGSIDFVGNLLNNPLYIWSYTNDTHDLVPGVTYTVNAKLIDRLHGIGV